MTRPHWLPAAALLLAAGFLPTVAAPFDFADDGNLVYPAPAGTAHVERWWDRVTDNVRHLGPFRPAVWAHWELTANAVGADPVAWRTLRLLWCGLAAAAMLWLMAELGVPPPAAVLATAAGTWNPVRAEVWVSLTLAEGVAMPFAVGALAAAARGRMHPGWWDAAAVGGLLVALGCKTTFAAIVPAMLVLRRPGVGLIAAYLAPLGLVAVHLGYFWANWHPGQYPVPGPTWDQTARVLGWLRGASGLDCLGVGVALSVFVTLRTGGSLPSFEGGVRAALLTLVCGSAAYLPVGIMAARYTLPAAWGFDLLLAALLCRLFAAPDSRMKQLALAALAVGLLALLVATVGRQEKATARNRLLWQALHHVEATAPANARVEWAADLPPEEGIHFAWHLRHRGRPDIVVSLEGVRRVELPPADRPADLRLTSAAPAPGWRRDDEFGVRYRLGRRGWTVRVDGRSADAPPLYLDPAYLAAALGIVGREPGP
jgi:hypothetical protein